MIPGRGSRNLRRRDLGSHRTCASSAILRDVAERGYIARISTSNPAAGPTAQCVYLQVIDPEAFVGLDALVEQSDFLAEACRANRPAATSGLPVRVLGDAAARNGREALAESVSRNPETVQALDRVAAACGQPPLGE